MAAASSIVSTGLRGRIERLLHGDIREDDLRELFFNMREESGGRGTVSEIAHFLAHPGTRTQGITRQECRDFFAQARMLFSLHYSRIITSSIPDTVPEAFRASLRRMRKSVLKRETGLNLAQAKQVLETVL